MPGFPERLEGREPGRFQSPFGRSFLSLEQFEFGELEEVGEVIGVVGRGLVGNFLAFGPDRREAKSFEVVA